MNEPLYRSTSNRMIAGVAGGLATWLNIDPSLVRIAWVLLAVFSGGIFALIYFVMMIVVPLPPPGWVPRARDAGAWAPPPGTEPVEGWAPGGGPGPGQSPDPSSGWATPPPPWPTPPQGWNTQRAAGNAGLVAGGVLVLLGIWFLIDEYVDIDWSLAWPVAIIAVGGLLIVGAVRRAR